MFVGLQVQSWANERDRQRLEYAYTLKLYEEVKDLQATREGLVGTRASNAQGLMSSKPVLAGKVDRPLTRVECNALAYSYFVSNPTDDVASLNELQQSGQLALFRNRQVSSALNEYQLVRTRARDSQAGIASITGTTALVTKYPDLISVVEFANLSEGTAPQNYGQFECNLAKMRENQGFMNDFDLIQSNIHFHVRDNQLVSDSLETLRLTLAGAVEQQQP